MMSYGTAAAAAVVDVDAVGFAAVAVGSAGVGY